MRCSKLHFVVPGLLSAVCLCAQTVGVYPLFVTTADFNHDGKLDLAVANSALGEGGSVAILLGNGDGTFQPATFLPSGTYPRSIAVADFNRDGNLDLAVADEGSTGAGGIAVFIGNGDGTFKPALFFSAGVNPASVIARDFNGDGIPDVAVANSQQLQAISPIAPGSVSIMLGNGDGTLRPPSFVDAGNFPIFITAGDFNRDGRLDIAAANFGATAVSVLLGNGNGTLQPSLYYGAGHEPFAVASADVNRDGKLDLIVANYGETTSNGSVSVLLGNGDGTFQPTEYIPAGAEPSFIAVADFNRDGKPDLAVVESGGPGFGDVAIMLGNGDGTFQTASRLSAGDHPTSVAVGDFNRDGKVDLAVSNAGRFPQLGTVSILLGDGKGGFQPARPE